MKPKARLGLIVWLASLAIAAIIVARARYSADLSAFLPRTATPEQQLLVDQLRDGPASRLMLIAIEGSSAERRAALSHALIEKLRAGGRFAFVSNGEPLSADRDRRFVFEHRYLLSDSVEPRRFTVQGLREALEESIDALASPAGFMAKGLLANDPTGETLAILDRFDRGVQPRRAGGVWISPDGDRALLIAQTRAAGSDTDAQAAAIEEVRSAFAQLQSNTGTGPARLVISGPGVFAVTARATIEHEALRLSIVSSVLIIALLFAVYRSARTLLLGLVPVISGALSGIAAVALGFGFVHGLTLGFGITLIGEAVDYSIYLFVQAQDEGAWTDDAFERWRGRYWPTVRLGMWTSVCGFASLLPSGFTGLAQLGLYSTTGLIAAALVTRFVLPELLPHRLAMRDLAPLGRTFARVFASGTLLRLIPIAALAGSGLVLHAHRDSLWNRELAALSPIPDDALARDARLRAELGASDARALVLIRGSTLEAALARAERVAADLEPLVDQKVIAGFETPARFLPSAATQDARRASLPPEPLLRERLQAALAGLPLRMEALSPFLKDIEAARRSPDVTVEDLRDTSMAAGAESLIMRGKSGFTVLLPLHAVDTRPNGAPIDVARVRASLSEDVRSSAVVIDLKSESDALYSAYLSEALRLSGAALALIGLLLAFALRSVTRLMRVFIPLIAAVAAVAAVLAEVGRSMTILHLIGMLLIVAIGSNYALFFDRERGNARDRRTDLMLASLWIANTATVVGFGVLAFSHVPVLAALGMTVAPGALLALIFSALWAPSMERHA